VSFAIVVLIARIGLVAVVYLFLFLVVRAGYREVRATNSVMKTMPGQAGASVAPRLLVLAAGQTPYQVGQEFRLRNPTLLGRDPGSDIVVEDEWVSGQHLRLSAKASDWTAQDMNSTNGTRINGVRLQGTAPLKTGDVLDVGRLRLRFAVDS